MNKENTIERNIYRAFDTAERKCLVRFPRGEVFLRFQAAFAPFTHGAGKTLVDKKAFAFARTASAALVSDVMNAVYTKAICIEMLPKGFEVDGFAVFRFIDIIKFYVDDGESIGVTVLV